MEYRHYSHEDATSHKRSPAEESFYESFLLQKGSDISNLYASNLYQMQCYSKKLKHITRQRTYQASEMEREMKKLQKKMDCLKNKCRKVHYLNQKCASSGCITDLKSRNNSPSLPRLVSRLTTPSITRSLSEIDLDDNCQSTKPLSKSWSNLSRLKDHKDDSDSLLRKDTENDSNKLSPSMFITDPKALQESSASNPSSPVGAAAKGNIRYCRSHEDLKCLSAHRGERVRSNTFTKPGPCNKKAQDEELHVRYVPREDRVRSAFALPKI